MFVFLFSTPVDVQVKSCCIRWILFKAYCVYAYSDLSNGLLQYTVVINSATCDVSYNSARKQY